MVRKGRYIPNRLASYRKQMGYSQQYVAFFLGFSSTSRISLWERGQALPSADNLLKLAALYAVLVEDLYLDLFLSIKAELKDKYRILELTGGILINCEKVSKKKRKGIIDDDKRINNK